MKDSQLENGTGAGERTVIATQTIADNGKLPNHKRRVERIMSGEPAIDTLLNRARWASFSPDQAALDARIERIIKSRISHPFKIEENYTFANKLFSANLLG